MWLRVVLLLWAWVQVNVQTAVYCTYSIWTLSLCQLGGKEMLVSLEYVWTGTNFEPWTLWTYCVIVRTNAHEMHAHILSFLSILKLETKYSSSKTEKSVIVLALIYIKLNQRVVWCHFKLNQSKTNLAWCLFKLANANFSRFFMFNAVKLLSVIHYIQWYIIKSDGTLLDYSIILLNLSKHI